MNKALQQRQKIELTNMQSNQSGKRMIQLRLRTITPNYAGMSDPETTTEDNVHPTNPFNDTKVREGKNKMVPRNYAQDLCRT